MELTKENLEETIQAITDGGSDIVLFVAPNGVQISLNSMLIMLDKK